MNCEALFTDVVRVSLRLEHFFLLGLWLRAAFCQHCVTERRSGSGGSSSSTSGKKNSASEQNARHAAARTRERCHARKLRGTSREASDGICGGVTASRCTAGGGCAQAALFRDAASALARSTAPGLGYGRCWKRGPDAVVSAPVLASPFLWSPALQLPRGASE